MTTTPESITPASAAAAAASVPGMPALATDAEVQQFVRIYGGWHRCGRAVTPTQFRCPCQPTAIMDPHEIWPRRLQPNYRSHVQVLLAMPTLLRTALLDYLAARRTRRLAAAALVAAAAAHQEAINDFDHADRAMIDTRSALDRQTDDLATLLVQVGAASDS